MARIRVSDGLKQLPPYLFVEIDKAKKKARAEGRDIIDLGIGDPDKPTPDFVIDALCAAARNPATHRYPLDSGLSELRTAISSWYHRRFGVRLDPEAEVLPLIGSKEGIAHAPLAFLNPGDTALVPDPSYPPYRNAVILVSGKAELMPLLEVNDFLPDLKKIPSKAARKAKIMFINYPNNPTSACADKAFFKEAIAFASKHGIMVLHDAAYSEIAFDGYRPESILEFKGAKDIGIEFHSLSKSYNMTGWRIGFAVGNARMIGALGKVKANIDSGIFTAVQRAGVTALEKGDEFTASMKKIYQDRRDVLCDGLERIGLRFKRPRASFYLWVNVPKGMDSMRAASLFLEKADIAVTPGVGFGLYGEGYIRIALTVDSGRLKEAVDRIKKII